MTGHFSGFIDEIWINLASGHGGPGAVSFRREAMVPRGGPDGGDGGRGGDVILKTSPHLNSLIHLKSKKKYAAKNGAPGQGMNKTGADGGDLILHLPPGTLVKDEGGEVIVDLEASDSYCLLKGGRGGRGNTFFKTSVNQAPHWAQPGEEGQELLVHLELKLLADVGIIGIPNAGKSTLISRISAARPKIADYPFTTLVPQLGVVSLGEFRSFVVADIPGLIRGAHEGSGLGIQFLRHIERTKVFVHLIDIHTTSSGGPVQDYRDINYELEMYDQQQGRRCLNHPQIVVLNKSDALSTEEVRDRVENFKRQTGIEPLVISAVSGKNVKELIHRIGEYLEENQDGKKTD